MVARPDYTNTVAGPDRAVGEPAVAWRSRGQGFFSVALPTGSTNGQVTFDERQFYTRAGDFQLDRDGYMVNGAGYCAAGLGRRTAPASPDRTQLAPIRVSDLVFNPIATSDHRPRRRTCRPAAPTAVTTPAQRL